MCIDFYLLKFVTLFNYKTNDITKKNCTCLNLSFDI